MKKNYIFEVIISLTLIFLVCFITYNFRDISYIYRKKKQIYTSTKQLIKLSKNRKSHLNYKSIPDKIITLHDSLDSILIIKPKSNKSANARLKEISYIKTRIREQLSDYKSQSDNIENNDNDFEQISFKWFKDHIENSFDNWNSVEYSRRLNFDEFLEYLLPYRYKNEIIDEKSSLYKKKFSTILSNTGSSLDNTPLKDIVQNLNKYMLDISCYEKKDDKIGSLGKYDTLQFGLLGCDRHSEWAAKILNSCGIPTVMEYTPSWLNRSRNHFWVSSMDKNGIFYPFTPMYQQLYDTIYFQETSKVYRLTFSPQNSPANEKLLDEIIPEEFKSEFLKDVTEKYHQVLNLNEKIDNLRECLGIKFGQQDKFVATSSEYLPNTAS